MNMNNTIIMNISADTSQLRNAVTQLTWNTNFTIPNHAMKPTITAAIGYARNIINNGPMIRSLIRETNSVFGYSCTRVPLIPPKVLSAK